MKNSIKIIFGVFVLLLLIAMVLIIPSVITSATRSNQTKTLLQPSFQIPLSLPSNSPLLLILISPQYANDDTIISAVHQYQEQIKINPGYKSILILLTNNTNQEDHIDTIIENIATQNNLTACLILGEDIDMPIQTTYNSIAKPHINRWSTINTSNTQKTSICISLLQPTPNASYQQKQKEIIKTFNRFSNTRIIHLNRTSRIIEQSTLSSYSQKDYQMLAETIQARYQKNIEAKQISTLLTTPHDIICFHGHGKPHNIQLNSSSTLYVTSKMASLFPSTILAIDGCYTDSIYQKMHINPTPFISTICASNTLHMCFYGLLSQQTSTDSTNVITSILPELINGSTVAETINNANVAFDFVFTGDPTVQVI